MDEWLMDVNLHPRVMMSIIHLKRHSQNRMRRLYWGAAPAQTSPPAILLYFISTASRVQNPPVTFVARTHAAVAAGAPRGVGGRGRQPGVKLGEDLHKSKGSVHLRTLGAQWLRGSDERTPERGRSTRPQRG